MKKLLVILTGITCHVALLSQTHQDVQDGYTKYGRLLQYINNHYVDTADIKKLVEKAIVSTLQNLDPHSTYLSEKDVKAADESLKGNFEGIGIEFNILLDTLTVVSPISGGPSEMVGIQAGDRIVTIDKENVAGTGLTNDRVFKLLRGPKGTKVNLGIIRKGVAGALQFEVIRDKIPIHSLDASYEVKPGMIYMRLNRFSITSLQEMRDAMNTKFGKKPVSAMILDLRGNSGGVFPVAIELANQFFDKGHLLVYSEGLHWPKSMELSNGDGFFMTGKLAVLIDEGSASASEIVAGAIQDWDRGTLIGRRSYGKGLVQQLMPLLDGSQLRLTIARYYTPTGRQIQRPYESGHIDKYYSDLYKRYANGEIFNKDSIHFPDSLKYYTLKEKRLVYGGGGIMPDVFMPLDTSSYSVYYSKLSRLGLFNQFSLSYMDQHRAELQKKYKDFATFDRNFEVSDELFEEFISYAESKDLPRDEKGIATSGEEIHLILKAYIARILWTTSEYYEVVNKRRDKTFLKAVELLE